MAARACRGSIGETRMNMNIAKAPAVAGMVVCMAAPGATAQDKPMGFFVTYG